MQQAFAASLECLGCSAFACALELEYPSDFARLAGAQMIAGSLPVWTPVEPRPALSLVLVRCSKLRRLARMLSKCRFQLVLLRATRLAVCLYLMLQLANLILAEVQAPLVVPVEHLATNRCFHPRPVVNWHQSQVGPNCHQA